jgi:serine protease Do
LPFLSLGNSDSVQIGQWVIAIGNPYQLSSTVTSGIVSAKGRTIDLLKGAYPLESFIQTDAVFNEGNSGGALLNARGELIGVNTAIFTKSGKFEGYSFAIPSNIVRKMVSDIMSYGKVQRAMLGVGIEDISDALSKKIGVDPETGVFINRISQGSAAEKAGMLYGDIITEINGKIVRSCPALQEQIALYKPGDIVNVKYLRSNNSYTGSLKLTSPISTAFDVIIRSDLELKAIGIELREQIMRNGEKGVIVHTIYQNTPSGKTAMESGFIINEVNGMKVSSADDVISEIRKNNSQLILKGRYRNMNKNYEYQINRQGTGL